MDRRQHVGGGHEILKVSWEICGQTILSVVSSSMNRSLYCCDKRYSGISIGIY